MAVLFTKAPDTAIVTGGTLAGSGTVAIGANTLSAWVNMTALSAQSELVEINDSVSGGFASLIEYDPAFGIVWLQRDSAGAGPSIISSLLPTPTIGTWYHLALSWDGTTLRTYVNGVSDITNTPAALGARGNWAFLQIGPAQAHIQDVHFFNAALSADEIMGLYRRRLSGRRANLLVHSPLHSTGGYLLVDMSGNGNNWTLSGSPAVSTVAPPQAGWGTRSQVELYSDNSATPKPAAADGDTLFGGAAAASRLASVAAGGDILFGGAAAASKLAAAAAGGDTLFGGTAAASKVRQAAGGGDTLFGGTVTSPVVTKFVAAGGDTLFGGIVAASASGPPGVGGRRVKNWRGPRRGRA